MKRGEGEMHASVCVCVGGGGYGYAQGGEKVLHEASHPST